MKGEEEPDAHVLGGLMGKMGWLVVLVGYVHAEMEQKTERENHHGVDHPEALAVMVDEEPWYQPAVVGIEHYHLEHRADATYSIANPVDAILMTDKMEGGEEQHAPRRDMDEDIPAGWWWHRATVLR